MEIPSSFQITRNRLNEGTVADVKSVIATSTIAPSFKLRVSKQLGNDTEFRFWWPATTDQRTVIEVFRALENEVEAAEYACYDDISSIDVGELSELSSTLLTYLEISSPDTTVSWRHDRENTPESLASIESGNPAMLASTIARIAILGTLEFQGHPSGIQHILEDYRGLLAHEMAAMEQEWF
jgi:hypothetical protein